MAEQLYAKDIAPRDPDGLPLEYHGGIEQRDYTKSEWDALPDETKATMRNSKLFDLRHDAPKDAAAAERRIERAEPAGSDTLPVVSAPAPAKN